MNETKALRAGRGSSRWFRSGLLVLVLLPLLLMPLAAVFVFALRGGLGAFCGALRAPDAQFALRFSVVIAFATAADQCGARHVRRLRPEQVPLPRATARYDRGEPPGRDPDGGGGTSLLLLWGPIGLLGRCLEPLGFQPMFTPAGVLLAHLFVTFPYMLGAVKPLLDELETTYEEAAYTIGASRWQTFWLVILPACAAGSSAARC